MFKMVQKWLHATLCLSLEDRILNHDLKSRDLVIFHYESQYLST